MRRLSDINRSIRRMKAQKIPVETLRSEYKEIFNSDSKAYGGEGNVNPRAKTAKKEICDERDYSIKLKLPGLGVTILSCTPGPEEKPVKPAKTKTVAKKTSVNKEDKK